MAQPRRVLSELPLHPYPAASPDYRLKIDGLVRQPSSLSLADLQGLGRAVVAADFACLEGWVVLGQEWVGIPLDTVLRLAEPLDGARWVNVSSDDFVLPVPVEASSDALLALSLNGAPLAREHGAPVRLVVRDGECFTSVKWVDHLHLSADPAENTAERIARARLAR